MATRPKKAEFWDKKSINNANLLKIKKANDSDT